MRYWNKISLGLVLMVVPFGAIANTQNIDPRLQSSMVTLSDHSISIGALLKRVSKQTGVDLEMDDHTTLSGTLLYVNLKKVSLISFLYSLTSLLSLKKSAIYWERNAGSKLPSYWLMESQDVRDLLGSIQAIQFQHMRDVLATLKGLAYATGSDRVDWFKKYLKEVGCSPAEIKSELNYETKDYPDIDDPQQKDADSWIRFFYEDMPSNLRYSLTHTPSQFHIPYSDISPAGRTFLSKWWETHSGHLMQVSQINGHMNYKSLPNPMPKDLDVSNDSPGGPFNIAFGFATPGFCQNIEYNFSLAKMIEQQWIGKGDTKAGQYENTTLQPPVGYKPVVRHKLTKIERMEELMQDRVVAKMHGAAIPSAQSIPAYTDMSPQQNLKDQIDEVSSALNISIMGMVPSTQLTMQQGPFSMKFGDYLNSLSTTHNFPLMHKWHDGMLLLCPPSFFYLPNNALPYSTVLRLKQAALPGKMLSLQTTGGLLSGLNRHQKSYAGLILGVDDGVAASEVYSLEIRYPGITDTGGVQLTTGLLSELQSVFPDSMNLVDSTSTYTKVRIIRVIMQQGPRVLYQIELLPRDNSSGLTIGGFSKTPPPVSTKDALKQVVGK